MTAIAWKAQLIDLGDPLLPIVATISAPEILNPSFGSLLDVAGNLHLELRPGTAFINHVITAGGGPSWDGPILAYLLRLSIDDGVTWPTAGWLKRGSVRIAGGSVGITIDQADIVEGFSYSYIDEASYINIPVQYVMNAAHGAIPISSANLITSSAFLPSWWAGLFAHAPGKNAMSTYLKFNAITNTILEDINVDTIMNSDSLLNTAANTIAGVSGVFDPANPDRFGALQHLSFDISTMTVHVGYRGGTPALTVTGAKRPSECDETIECSIVDMETVDIEFDLSTFFGQTEVVGSSSNHGMPDGGTFTGVAVINKPSDGGSTGIYDNLVWLAITTAGGGGGGIYSWLGDGKLRPISQAMDTNGLAIDGTALQAYAATRIGLFTRNLTAPYVSDAWTRVGDLTLELTKVWIPAEGVIYAIAGGSNNNSGSNGVWRYTATDGWKRAIGLTSLIDASGGDTALYYTDSVAPFTVTMTTYPSTGAGTPIAIPTGAHIIGMDFNASGDVVVRTEIGALGLYVLSGSSITLVDSTTSLVDQFGPLAVSRFLSYLGNINGQFVDSFVITDRGIWWRDASGLDFHSTDGQSGVQDVKAVYIDVGNAQTVMGRVFVPIVAVSDHSLYISRDGGLHWCDEMAQNVDALVAWYEAVKRISGDYPHGDIGALATNVIDPYTGAQDPTDPEGNGLIIYIPDGDVLTLPVNWTISRRWTTNGRYTCRLVITDSNAPYNAIKLAEASDISADVLRTVDDASSACLLFMYRILSQASKPQTAIKLTVAALSQEAAINTLKCGDSVSLDLYAAFLGSDGETTTVLANFDAATRYIVAKACRQGTEGGLLWDLTLVSNTTYDLLDMTKIIAGIANGQAKDRRRAKPRHR